MAEDVGTNGILESAIKRSVDKLAEKGVEGCTTKDVILASFASLSLGGGLAKSSQLDFITDEIKKFGWKIIATCFTTILAIVITLIFL